MKVNLPTNNFSFFKIVSGTLFLAAALVSPLVAAYSFIMALSVGRAHSLGAWLAMWRAGKLNWMYISWMIFFVLTITYWGFRITTPLTLAFVTHILFSFHFLFDEFDLQEEKRTAGNILSSICPLILVCLFLTREYFTLLIPFNIFVTLAASFWTIEVVYLRELNWFFLHTKILALYILISIYTGSTASSVLSVFLMFHYFFWFIYPIYKINKYKPEERDGFIMMILLIIGASLFFAATRSSYGPDILELSLRSFQVGTIVHILSTAPFGYIFGLPKPKVYA